jgi:hypothetical protein
MALAARHRDVVQEVGEVGGPAEDRDGFEAVRPRHPQEEDVVQREQVEERVTGEEVERARLAAAEEVLVVVEEEPGEGLAVLDQLDGPGFQAPVEGAHLAPAVLRHPGKEGLLRGGQVEDVDGVVDLGLAGLRPVAAGEDRMEADVAADVAPPPDEVAEPAPEERAAGRAGEAAEAVGGDQVAGPGLPALGEGADDAGRAVLEAVEEGRGRSAAGHAGHAGHGPAALPGVSEAVGDPFQAAAPARPVFERQEVFANRHPRSQLR